MATSSLLEQFLSEECIPFVRQLLEEAMADPSLKRRVFEFNRFEVTIDHDASVAEIADVLDASDAGIELVSLSELAKALARSLPPRV